MNQQIARALRDADRADAQQHDTRALTTAPVDGAQLLDDLVAAYKRYVVLTESQAIIMALWTVHTHAIDAADATPYIHVSSAEPESGKSRLLEVGAKLAARPWLTGRTSVAAFVRKLAKDHVTMLFDEADAAFGGNKEFVEAFRGILNHGYTRGFPATLCVGQGRNIETKDYDVFGPKALAGLRDDIIPDTVRSRSIPIRLQRKKASENVERFRRREVAEPLAQLHSRAANWSSANVGALTAARPSMPDALKDRQQDVVEPLLAIADLAGAAWPQRARGAVMEILTSEEADDPSTGLQLLRDILAIFDDLQPDDVEPDRISSGELVRRLAAIEGSPWPEYSRGNPISPTGVARLLRQYVSRGGHRVRPKNIRLENGKVVKGYERAQFEDAWERFLSLPAFGAATDATTLTPQTFAPEHSAATNAAVAATENGANSHYIHDVASVAAQRLA